MRSEDFKESLRVKAKAMLKDLPDRFAGVDIRDIRLLIEELSVHQIELELQNDELISIQKNLEESRQRYISLFDKAPVGYVILNSVGMVKQFNTTFFRMIGKADIKLSGMAFADLLATSDGELFRARYKALFKAPAGKQIQARLMTGNREQTVVWLEATHHVENEPNRRGGSEELLLSVADVNELNQTKTELKKALDDTEFREKEVSALLEGAQAVLEQSDFPSTARRLFDTCSRIIGSTSGYIALLSDDGKENEVLFLEDGGLPCTVDPELPMPIRGLREAAYRTGKAVYDNRFMDSPWTEYLPKGHVRLENVMFSPLVINGRTVGVMGLANKSGDFNDNDMSIAQGFGELCAIALKNSRLIEKRDQAQREKEMVIEELQAALARVKKLSGLIPICSYCKKIRDDEGCWNQLEDYLDEHSDAQLSHGICRDCANQHHPELGLYDE
ncbi:MAG: PAS domain S-box protein [Desulfobacteraceae bacterium]|nr:MAG: PAS domain S-box protein [Desulfobacteraceae bacterium]